MVVEPQETLPLAELHKTDLSTIITALAIRHVLIKFNPNSIVSSVQLQELLKVKFPKLNIGKNKIRHSLAHLGIRASYYTTGYEVGALLENIDKAVKTKYKLFFEPILDLFCK